LESLKLMSGQELPRSEDGRITLRAIARRVGCSHVTVARALSDTGAVREATRDRIRRVAREMGYAPDPVMSRMMQHIRESPERRKTETIGFVCSNLEPSMTCINCYGST